MIIDGKHIGLTAEQIAKRRNSIGGSDCVIWEGGKDNLGYGKKWDRSKQRMVNAHRYFYEQKHGRLPAKTHVDHLCRNPSCVNLDHLEAVSVSENILRGKRYKRAIKTHCIRGHELTPEIIISGPGNRKDCRLCYRDNNRRYYMRKKNAG